MAGGGVAIQAQEVGKRYRLGELSGGYELLTEALVKRVRRLGRGGEHRDDFWALRGIDFEVARGETFGIIGHNGAGKSTLLKILSRVTPPTTGRIDVNGRVGALLEVGTGFNQELTGRENVYLNGAVLGMRKAEIERKFDEIVDFAEVERFIDTPVKRYSSGMYLRLAFAVAAHLEPEILIVDEVLSVGDLAFQEKCLGRMERVAGEGRTVLFVSHNLTAVQALCPRSMLLSRGEKLMEGPTSEVISEYVAGVRAESASDLSGRLDREGSGRFRFESIRFESEGHPVDMPLTGTPVEIVLGYASSDGRPVRQATFSVTVYTLLGGLILNLESSVAGTQFGELPSRGEVRVRVPRFPLPAGRYAINLFGTANTEVADWVQRACELTVGEGDFYGSGQRPAESHQTVLVDQDWSLRGADQLASGARQPADTPA
jgi:lipopolysaccharide transport system ATP-binding protein